MIELVWVACLVTNTNHCEQRGRLFEDVGLMTCMAQGQAQLAQWVGENPRWRVMRWSCQTFDPSRKDV